MALLPGKWLAAARGLNPATRELAIVTGALLLGALAMPLLVWVAGSAALGPYANGGFRALLDDYSRGLAAGSLPNWIVLASPYVLVSLVRIVRRTLASIARRS